MLSQIIGPVMLLALFYSRVVQSIEEYLIDFFQIVVLILQFELEFGRGFLEVAIQVHRLWNNISIYLNLLTIISYC